MIRIDKEELTQKQELTVDVESQEKLPGQINGESVQCGETQEHEIRLERYLRNT